MAYRPGGNLTNRSTVGGQSEFQIRIDPSADMDIHDTIEHLHNKVKSLKQLTRDIDEETKLRGTLVHELEAAMYKAQASMKETFRRMNKKYNQGVLGGNHMVALALFAFFLILGMYSLIRAQRFLAFFGLA